MLRSKRILCWLLVFILALSMCSFAAAAPAEGGLSNFKKANAYEAGQFTDVAKQWYAGNVQAAYELGLMQGNPDGTFNPTGSIKVIETIVTACRLHSIYHTGKSEFGSGSPWYQPYVDYAVSNGIIAAGEYSSYNAPATRAQFISILAKALPGEALPTINSIAKGSLPDVPAGAAFADAVYLMYNAGILVGNDDYGTFDPDGTINRAQSAAIITRMADTSLRIEKVLKEYDSCPPTGILVYDYGSTRISITDERGEVLSEYTTKEYAPGQNSQLMADMMPWEAHSSITWSSSDPTVADVDRFGRLEVYRQGEAVITATAYNGAEGIFIVSVPYPEAELQYELTADGKGYEIVGCDADAYAVHIPAEYNGLPVVSVKGGAFMKCSELRYFTVDDKQAVFYEEDGVLFADLPEKTLVVFPARYDVTEYYYAPADTVEIAPYAFAGIRWGGIRSATLSEGLLTVGDYAFANNGSGLSIYAPDSLVNIGRHLFQDQTSSVAIYGHWNTAIAEYANQNQIPFAGVFDTFPVPEDSVLIEKPENITSGTGFVPAEGEVREFTDLAYIYYGRQVVADYDIASYQEGFSGEVLLKLKDQWKEIVPDVKGNIWTDMPVQTGLYGVGYTESDAVLRSYDRYGNLLAVQHVSGDFAFCFPGAAELGITGGSKTTFSILPYEPIYLLSGGTYSLQNASWYTTDHGSAYLFFVQQYPGGAVSQAMPNFLNVFVAGNYGEFTDSGYKIGFVELYDVSRMDELTAYLSLDGMNCVVDNDEMLCLVRSGFEGSGTFGPVALDTWRTVKSFMKGRYIPEDFSVGRLKVVADGTWPSAADGIVFLDEYVVAGNTLTLAHEFVHAVDWDIPAFGLVSPSAWAEGRAEYISYKVCKQLGLNYGDRGSEYDWSYLSPEDKTDFFRYYYFSTNRYTEYEVGFHFLCYLNETYGESVSAGIMANIAALTQWDSTQRSEANAVLFKKCVEDATEVGVFQNFVRDVIEK